MYNDQRLEFGNKIEGVNYRERLGVYALILNERKKVAVVKVRDGYFLPGGGIEDSETLEECLKRECSEELGYNIEVGEYIGQASNYTISYKSKEYLKAVGDFYEVKLLNVNNLKIEESHELLWLNPKAAIDKLSLEFQAWGVKKFISNK